MRRLFTGFQVDISTCYNVVVRCRHKIGPFLVPKPWCASAYIEDDLVGESQYDFGAYNATMPKTNVLVTSIYGRLVADKPFQ